MEKLEEAAAAENGLSRAYVASLLAWVFPGAGHFYLGKWGRGLVFLGIIATSLTLGCLLDGNLYRVLPNEPLSMLATIGAMGVGAPYFVLRFLLGYTGDVVASGYEYGSAFILTAGLMNLLLVLDGWDIATGRKE
jgi:hypothetical protein